MLPEWSKDQNEVDNWWWWWYQDSWDDQLWDSGFAVLYRGDLDSDESYDRASQFATLAEQRWGNAKHSTASRLWDASLPQDAYSGATPIDRPKRAYVRAHMPYMLSKLSAQQRKKAK